MADAASLHLDEGHGDSPRDLCRIECDGGAVSFDDGDREGIVFSWKDSCKGFLMADARGALPNGARKKTGKTRAWP